MSDAFGSRLDALDLSLFDKISSQSQDGDRRSWLAVQRSVRRPVGYTYLEIGSHMGGSIQPHLLDPMCTRIISIDKRPLSQPDDWTGALHYEGNSTSRMIANLRQIAANEVGKVSCFDSDAKDVEPSAFSESPDYCLIDGEHTYSAVLTDFEFCLSVCAPNAAICFHDEHIIWKVLPTILSSLQKRGIPFAARMLEGSTFAVFLRSCPAANDPYLSRHSKDGFSWLRGRRIWSMVPGLLRPAVRWATGWFKVGGPPVSQIGIAQEP